MTQFVKCKFRVSDTRLWTYVNDGAPVAEGDVVRVPHKSGDGWQKVFVAETTDVDPHLPYELKPILGLHVEEEPTALEAAVSAAPGREFNPDDPFGLPSLD